MRAEEDAASWVRLRNGRKLSHSRRDL